MPVNCTQRDHSATVLQSLAMLNSEFLFDQSDHFARRVVSSAGAEPTAQVRAAFQIALGREPEDSEVEECLTFLADQAALEAADASQKDQADGNDLAELCHMLLSTNEFLYVE